MDLFADLPLESWTNLVNLLHEHTSLCSLVSLSPFLEGFGSSELRASKAPIPWPEPREAGDFSGKFSMYRRPISGLPSGPVPVWEEDLLEGWTEVRLRRGSPGDTYVVHGSFGRDTSGLPQSHFKVDEI